MAGYREHVSVSGLCGVCYGVSAGYAFGFTPVQGALAGSLTWVAGMLPDLDSDTGKPIREVFSLVAAVVPLVLMRRLEEWCGGDREAAVLAAIGVYAAVRYGAAAVLSKLSVHRGMFHSIPAMLIAAELVFLAYRSDSPAVKALMAGGVAIGFLSHLVLDELYSVEWTGIRVRLNKAAGSAFKLVGRSYVPNVFTWTVLMFLTWLTLADAGLIRDADLPSPPPALRQAADEALERL
ncbi:MAG TPA: metal-dependent hydrolase [Planctomycetaceae bacterium]|nr:metal-dependent hydrolase [Planctomycetaceae bacterium]